MTTKEIGEEAKGFYEVIIADAAVRGFDHNQTVGLLVGLAAQLWIGNGGPFAEFVRVAERAYRSHRRARDSKS